MAFPWLCAGYTSSLRSWRRGREKNTEQPRKRETNRDKDRLRECAMAAAPRNLISLLKMAITRRRYTPPGHQALCNSGTPDSSMQSLGWKISPKKLYECMIKTRKNGFRYCTISVRRHCSTNSSPKTVAIIGQTISNELWWRALRFLVLSMYSQVCFLDYMIPELNDGTLKRSSSTEV